VKFRLLIVAAILLATGCVPRPRPVIQQAPVSQQPSVNQQPSGSSDTPEIKGDRDRDLYECERESAFAGVGDKRRVFDNCMKARGY